MGRRLNISQPTVIDTELVPLDEMFYIEPDGQTEQWYYDNTSQYAPNRKVTPLILTPRISAHDHDTGESYTPTIYTSRWYALEWDSTLNDYVETEIVNQTDSASADYVKMPDNTLKVKKNVGFEHGVTIRCVIVYIDPRDAGITYEVMDTVLLTTNRDSDVVIPEVAITSPSARSFNPLVDYDNQGNQLSQFEFKGTITNGVKQEVVNDAIGAYKIDGYGTEEVLPAPTDAGVVTSCAPTMDIRYSGVTRTDQKFTYRRTANGELLSAEGRAMILAMRGETVKWNQLLSPYHLHPNQHVYTNNGITWTIGDSYVIANGTASGQSQFTLYNDNVSTGFIGIVGHKYYSFFINGGSEQTYYGRMVNNGSGLANTLGEPVISACGSAVGSGVMLRVKDGVTVRNIRFTPMIIDLTEMFGAGNEPSLSDFESWLDANIGRERGYAYNAGELIPVKTTGFRTTGFNQWDEEWELGSLPSGAPSPASDRIRSKDYIDVLPNTDYFIRYTNQYYLANVYCYDAQKQVLGQASFGTYQQGKGSVFTTLANSRYIRLALSTVYGTTYNHDICINFSGSRKGEYEAGWTLTSLLNVTAIKGKLNGLGNSVYVFPDGLKKCVDAYDEIYVEDGTLKAVKKIIKVDLGSVTYAASGTGVWYSPNFATRFDVKISRILCSIYTKDSSSYSVSSPDKTINIDGNKNLYIHDNSITSSDLVNGHIAKLEGVEAYCELNTPEEYILDPIQDLGLEWYAVLNGIEVKADEAPFYVSGQHTDTLVVDAMYGEDINIVLRAFMDATQSELSPSKAYASLTWRIPDVDTHVVSENGSAVRSNTEYMRFSTTINVNGAVLADERKLKHIAQNWKYRADSETTEHDEGWGQEVLIEASKLRNSRVVIQGQSTRLTSTLVFPYVYVKGAYEALTLDDDTTPVTDSSGNPVYGRTVN